MAFIYKTTNLVNGKVYIGKTSKNRTNYLGSGIILRKATTKYGKENFRREIVAWCYGREHLNFLEKFYIKFFNSKAPTGYNLTDGGDGGDTLTFNPNRVEIGRKISKIKKGHLTLEETKRKISEANSGKSKSEEAKQKMSDNHSSLSGFFGKHTDESKKRISLASQNQKNRGYGMKGKHHSEETKQKMRENHRKEEPWLKGREPWNKGLRRNVYGNLG